MSNPTPVEQFLHELNGGVLAEKLAHILSDVAAGAIDHGKAGEITIKLSLKPMGENHMVNVIHKLSYSKPTKRGKASEEDTTETPMHVGRGGAHVVVPGGPSAERANAHAQGPQRRAHAQQLIRISNHCQLKRNENGPYSYQTDSGFSRSRCALR